MSSSSPNRSKAEVRPLEADPVVLEFPDPHPAAHPGDFEAVASLSEELGKVLAGLERDVERWGELAERA